MSRLHALLQTCTINPRDLLVNHVLPDLESVITHYQSMHNHSPFRHKRKQVIPLPIIEMVQRVIDLDTSEDTGYWYYQVYVVLLWMRSNCRFYEYMLGRNASHTWWQFTLKYMHAYETGEELLLYPSRWRAPNPMHLHNYTHDPPIKPNQYPLIVLVQEIIALFIVYHGCSSSSSLSLQEPFDMAT